jgi:dihydrofolate reductase
MSLSIIFARSSNHCIGHQGKVPWVLPDEYQHFDQTTADTAIIMGRRTYEDHCCEIPGRLNIVISRQPNYPTASGVLLTDSLTSAISLATAHHYRQCFVIGGSNLIVAALGQATDVFETIVDTQLGGDTYVPVLNFAAFNSSRILEHAIDQDHKLAFLILHHQRR